MSSSTPQKRKSLSVEKKLDIYEFEVDENEPKAKQKKKRGPKPGTKNKVKWCSNAKGIVKSPFKTDVGKKGTTVKRNPLATTVEKEAHKRILSTKNSSSPLFENKRRNVQEGISVSLNKNILNTQKENLTCLTFQISSAKKDASERVINTRRRSSKIGKRSARSEDDENVPPLEQKENFTQQASEIPADLTASGKRISYVRNSCNKGNRNTLFTDKDVLPTATHENHDVSHHTIEVPVLFHNHQDADPSKKNTSLSKEKPGYTPMSDDENVNKSYGDITFDTFFTSSPKKGCEKNKSTRPSFHNDSSYDYQINASTPVKNNYNDTCSSGSILNCFGFDELEQFEEPLVSPIKVSEASGSSHSCFSQNTPYKSIEKHQNNSKMKEEMPVKQVIRLLKYGAECEENNTETKNKSPSSSSPSPPIFNYPYPEDEETPIKITPVKKTPLKPKVPRRSYERPSFLRKKNKSVEEKSDESSDEETVKPLIQKKKNQGQSKKDQDEMQKWIKAFNSQCQAIDQFDLVVE